MDASTHDRPWYVVAGGAITLYLGVAWTIGLLTEFGDIHGDMWWAFLTPAIFIVVGSAILVGARWGWFAGVALGAFEAVARLSLTMSSWSDTSGRGHLLTRVVLPGMVLLVTLLPAPARRVFSVRVPALRV
jgi:hypothetical protein